MKPYHAASSRSSSIQWAEGLRRVPAASGDGGGTLWAAEVGAAGAGDPSGSAPDPAGLSLVHICTLGEFKLAIACGGHGASLVQVGPKRPSLGSVRGKVKGFSAGAARRMHRLVESIDQGQVLARWFSTGTCVVGEVSWENYEGVRRRYFERVRRRWGDRVCVVWKKEPHPKSGFPHLHALWFWIADPPSLDEFRLWNDDAWAESIGCSVEKVRRVGSEVTLMRKPAGCYFYCSKYLEKMQSKWPTVGRLWGVHNRGLLPISWHREVLPASVGVRFRRCCRKLQERRRRVLVRALVSPGREKWIAFRPDQKDGESLDDVARDWAAMGVRIRRAKRAVQRRRLVKGFVLDELSGRVERCEHLDEHVTECGSWHSIDSCELLRLRDFFVGDFLRGGGKMPADAAGVALASSAGQVSPSSLGRKLADGSHPPGG